MLFDTLFFASYMPQTFSGVYSCCTTLPHLPLAMSSRERGALGPFSSVGSVEECVHEAWQGSSEMRCSLILAVSPLALLEGARSHPLQS